MSIVCVVDKNGMRLMPTSRFGRVRHLLKDGKAVIVKRKPFTIQLLYDSPGITQPIEVCEDTGYKHIGLSIKSESKEYVSAQYDTLTDEKRKHDTQRMLKRTRRNRLRYRKPRFDNRKRDEGWLAPSIEHKKNLHVELIKRYASVMPITSVHIEVGQFDTTLLKAIEEGKEKPEGEDYQKGLRFNYATLREAVFVRDNYTCQVCGRGIDDNAILHEHHALYWMGRHGNSASELLTVCEKCHTPANHQKSGKLWGLKPKVARIEDAAFMNIVRWQIVNALKDAGFDVHTTYGAITKEKRLGLGINKTHANDAYVMGNYHPTKRAEFEHFQKKRRNNRVLEKFYDAKYIDSRDGQKHSGVELFNGRTNRDRIRDTENLHKYRKQKVSKGHRSLSRKANSLNRGDIVSFEGETLVVKGTHTNKSGYVSVEFETRTKSGRITASINKIKIIKQLYKDAWKRIA